MAFILKNKIFNYFGVYETLTDRFKDNVVDNGKGIKQRYYESIAEDFDEEIIPLMDLFIENLLPPQTALFKFVYYLEQMWGGVPLLFSNEIYRRKILRFINYIYSIKSTHESYKLLFKMAGVETIVITEDFTEYGFDSPTTFDSSERTFDSSCPNCTYYDITLTGSFLITEEIQMIFFRIIYFLEPINAKLRTLTYNGIEIVDDVLFTVNIDNEGILSYDLGLDKTITLSLTDEGHLIIEGDSSSKYSVNDEGHLIFTQ